MKTRARITAHALVLGLVLGPVPGRSASEPVASPPTESPWAAHLDVTQLRNSMLGTFLVETLGFDHVLQMRKSLAQDLALDPSTIDHVTLSGAGEDWRETSMVLRGNFGAVDLSAFPVVPHAGTLSRVRIHRGPASHGSVLYLARPSAGEVVAGTSPGAIREALDSLGSRRSSWEEADLADHVHTKLDAAAAVLALDIGRIGTELQFEADLTRSMRRSWLLVGARGEEVEVTMLVDSADAEGLSCLRDQLNLLTMTFMMAEGVPEEWLQLVQALRVNSRDNWLTVKISAPSEEVTRFLHAVAPLFQGEPGTGKDEPAGSD